MVREIGEGLSKVSFRFEVPDRAVETAQDVKPLIQPEGPHIPADEADPREAATSDAEHLGAQVYAADGMLSAQELEVPTRAAGDIQPRTTSGSAVASGQCLESS
jgi:hypothetical protein